MEKLEEKIMKLDYGKSALNIGSLRTLQEIELEETLDSIKLVYDNFGFEGKEISDNVFIATENNEILEVMRLRSKVFSKMGYNKEFPESIPGLNFDNYDKNSIILASHRGGEITGTMRIILDGRNKLQSDKKYDLNFQREKSSIAELSRLVVEPEHQSKGIEFKNLFSAAYKSAEKINVSKYILGILKSHVSLYDKFGGVDCIYQGAYGDISDECVILTWDIEKISPFFKKAILKENGKYRH